MPKSQPRFFTKQCTPDFTPLDFRWKWRIARGKSASAVARKSNLEGSLRTGSAWLKERSGLRTFRTKRSPPLSTRASPPSASLKSTAQLCGSASRTAVARETAARARKIARLLLDLDAVFLFDHLHGLDVVRFLAE